MNIAPADLTEEQREILQWLYERDGRRGGLSFAGWLRTSGAAYSSEDEGAVRLWVELEDPPAYSNLFPGWYVVITDGDWDTARDQGPAPTLPERIRWWVEGEFPARYVDAVTSDLIDVATANRHGNVFEREAVRRILGE
ncbi:MAG: hypothetical protein ACOC9H_02020 [Gemmatimonadota bacterium]